MKHFDTVAFDYAECLNQVGEMKALLGAKASLSERSDVLPFFQSRQQLASLFGMFNRWIGSANRFAKEFDIFGDFACDLAVGDWERGAFCFVEFEDARENSIFEKKGTKATREWGKRFEHGYSQIIDWLYKLANQENNLALLDRFGRREITYEAVLVIGRNQFQSEAEKLRLQWRSDKTSVNQKKVLCLTFDELLSQFETRLSAFAAVEASVTGRISPRKEDT